MPAELPIGVFDSGVGGLTVMRAVADHLPAENLLYLGDTARVPYGNRGADTVKRYALNAASFLRDRGIKALVVACNTATAYALDTLIEHHPDIPILGVVNPVADVATQVSVSRHVGVIGTRGTIASGCYDRALLERGVRVTATACPLFVPLAEEGWTEGDVVRSVAREYLREFEHADLDTLILGCTHYPLLAAEIQAVVDEVAGRRVTLLDSGRATASALSVMLASRGMLRTSGARTLRFLATDDPTSFSRTARKFFGGELDEVEHVDIVDVSDSKRVTR